MTDLPPPPAGYDGDYSRPLDPQFVDPNFGRAPFAPPYPPSYPPPPVPPPPRGYRSKRRNAFALGVLGGLVVVLALVLALLSATGPDETRGLEVLPPDPALTGPALTDPATSGPPTAGQVPTDVPDLQATIVGVQFFQALLTKDAAAVDDVTCAGAVLGVTSDLPRIVSAVPSGAATVAGTTATIQGSVLLTDGTGYDLQVSMRERSPTWCVQSDEKR